MPGLVPTVCQRQLRRQCRAFAQVTVSRVRLEQFIAAELTYFSQRQQTPLRLERIVQASTPGKVAQLVYKELPERFAARIKHVENMKGWEQLPELKQLRQIFSDSFRDLRLSEMPRVEEPSVSELAAFTDVIQGIRRRHLPVVVLLAEALRNMDPENLQSWADTFLLNRITTEMLTSHYVAIVEAASGGDAFRNRTNGRIGIVDTTCNPGEICERVAETVRESLSDTDGRGINIMVHSNNCVSSQAEIKFSYVPTYLFYIVRELLRNSARATAEAVAASGGDPAEYERRPIKVTVCADRFKVGIRISDKGGGVSFGDAERWWSYTFSTSKQTNKDYMDRSPLSGKGMGLPLSRLYARYLGGGLELMNMPGVGVDAYLFLSRIEPTEDIFHMSSLGSVSDPILSW